MQNWAKYWAKKGKNGQKSHLAHPTQESKPGGGEVDSPSQHGKSDISHMCVKDSTKAHPQADLEGSS